MPSQTANHRSDVTASRHWPRLGALSRRLKNRPDSEHEQALVRIAILSVACLYIIYLLGAGRLGPDKTYLIQLALFVIFLAAVIFAAILMRPHASPIRRVLGMFMDFGSVSYMLYALEDKGTLFFAVYLWVTIGNGLRFGAPYLYAAMTIAMAAFIVMVFNSDYWSGQWGFNVGLIVALIAVPLYLSALLKKLNAQHEELKSLYRQAARHATRDSLTRLSNRKHIYDQITGLIADSGTTTQSFSLLYIDLDGFKAINDSLGHTGGDSLLENAARRLEQCVRKSDMVARVGGDEFIVLLQDIAPTDAPRVAEKVIRSLSAPFNISRKSVAVTASVGLATYPQDGADATALIANADKAMYEAKRSGKNSYRVYQTAVQRIHNKRSKRA